MIAIDSSFRVVKWQFKSVVRITTRQRLHLTILVQQSLTRLRRYSTWIRLPVHPGMSNTRNASNDICDIHHYRYRLRSKLVIDSGRLDPAVRNPDTEGHHHAFQIDFGNYVTMGFENY